MEALVHAFRALSDPTRLRILRLVSQAPLNVSELVSLVGVGQPSVSHHLGKLKDLGLIREERQAGFSFYSLELPAKDARWPLIKLAQAERDEKGDLARLGDLLRQRADRQALNEKLLEPGQSWFWWAEAACALLPPLQVVDFGCGTGVLSVSMAAWARGVVAIDNNPLVLKKAKERAARAGATNIRFRCEDLADLSLESGRTDLVVLSQTLHHVEEPLAVVREAARLLKPGGRVVVLELLPHREAWVRERLGHRHLGFRPQEIGALLTQAGLTPSVRRSRPREAQSPFRVFLVVGEKKR